ncbi:hypothetical protein DTO164E3_5200 [Paecilomyces variotii]|nr:hypothetical protein DTO164E3_5200 [Paecilomyces variotii]KAJ9360808.1 hypothetical protein DTO027B9_1202 [Paecilomyces variotii]
MDGSKPSSPTSVFSFHRKPRSPETTTTTATVPTQQEREAIILEAKRHIRDVVRNDWDYETSLTNSPPSAGSNASSTTATTPSSSAPTTTNSSTTTTATATTSSSTAGTESLSDVVGWRLREYDSSGSEFDPEQAGPAQAARQHRRPEQGKDSDAAVRANVVERRRRRRRQLEEEMRWNIGLRIWVERRNAWSGARTRADVKRTSGAQAAPSAAQEVDQKIAEKAPLVRPLSSESTGSRSTVPAEGEERGDQASQPSSDGSSLVPETEALSVSENHDAAAKEGGTSVPATTKEEQSTGEEKDDDEDPNEPLVPLVRPLLPESNPIRSSIKPSLYPSIYSKIVVQGLTPTVPINLADVTRAMVEGWKADGQWPPKPTPQAPGDNIVTRRRANAANNTGPNNDEKRKSHGVAGAMKKVLGFSGIHHYPFHRRGSSQGTGGDGANDVPLVEENPETQKT